jgi:hypothetical protein
MYHYFNDHYKLIFTFTLFAVSSNDSSICGDSVFLSQFNL